ncbi:MAG: hypothetical protein GC158_05895 [Cyanobacteria bacterium RI_101]|nr:hypothetical protein [Cyanobacteria bacterium RI_101]
MTNPAQEPLTSADAQSTQPWWNRPVTGEGGLLSDLLKKSGKQDVPESAITQWKRQMLDIRVFAKTAEAIDSDKFGAEEFLMFVKTKYMLSKGIGEYAGLYESARLLQLAINAKDSFIAIDQTELRYRGYKQQDFYQFIEGLLKTGADPQSFRQQVTEKAGELVIQIKTSEGQEAIQSYVEHLDQISENEFGLKLLALLKTFQLTDYSVLRTVADLILNIESHHIYNINQLANIVAQNLNQFEKLSKIIELSDSQNNPQSYAAIVQYIILSHQHEISYLKFNELMRVLRKWYRYYQSLREILDNHPANQFKQPPEFAEAIPGETLYVKYLKWLTDKKTGLVYMDLT